MPKHRCGNCRHFLGGSDFPCFAKTLEALFRADPHSGPCENWKKELPPVDTAPCATCPFFDPDPDHEPPFQICLRSQEFFHQGKRRARLPFQWSFDYPYRRPTDSCHLNPTPPQ